MNNAHDSAHVSTTWKYFYKVNLLSHVKKKFGVGMREKGSWLKLSSNFGNVDKKQHLSPL